MEKLERGRDKKAQKASWNDIALRKYKMEGFLKLLALLLTLFFIFMFLLGLNIKRRARKMQGKEFKALRDGIVYFYSERCGACKMMRPEIEKLKESVEVLELDVARPEGYKMAQELGIVATPTT